MKIFYRRRITLFEFVEQKSETWAATILSARTLRYFNTIILQFFFLFFTHYLLNLKFQLRFQKFFSRLIKIGFGNFMILHVSDDLKWLEKSVLKNYLTMWISSLKQIRARRTAMISAGLIIAPSIWRVMFVDERVSICLDFWNGLVSDCYLRAYERKIRLACWGRVIAVNLGWST